MPIRILHIVTYMGRGGLETMLMTDLQTIWIIIFHREQPNARAASRK